MKTKGTKMGKGAEEDKKNGVGSRGGALEMRMTGRNWERIMRNGSMEVILCQ